MKYNLPRNKELIVFDGICNLCNKAVQYIIKHDKHNHFMFTALQSETGQQIIIDFKLDPLKTDSILLYTSQNKLFYKSTAALKIAAKLGFPRNLLSVFLVLPAFIRHWIYDLIARNRYRWFGKMETCMIPSPALEEKFLNK